MKLPETIAGIQECFGINYRTLLSVNPKTKKSSIETRILHLLPSDLSGVNVCPGAGNCRRICLHFAGNPAYFNAKQKARQRKTKALTEVPSHFLNLLAVAIAYEYHANKHQPLAIRLNGTSDIVWEDLNFNLSAAVCDFIGKRFGVTLQPGHCDNILKVFQGLNVTFYDYTKLARDWRKCKELNYHLTVSFDGYGNKQNAKVCRDAWQNGINIAAAFNIKRGQRLPAEIIYNPLKIAAPVYDGDLSDFRPGDPGGHLIGLRFKIPRKVTFSADDVARFCIC